MTREKVIELFDYKDGHLYVKKKRHKRKIGDKVGKLNADGYVHIDIDGKIYKAHRLIFLMHHGWLPKFLDHIDLNKQNNKIDNLRPATCAQNQANKPLQKSNTSGYKGVTKKCKRRWMARISVNGERKYLGLYRTKEEAYDIYKQAAINIYGQYANV